MAVRAPSIGSLSARRRSREDYLRALLVSKLTDAATTIVGLSFVPYVTEGNPMARELIEGIGTVPGVLVGSLVAVTIVVLATETAVGISTVYANGDDRLAPRIRLVGYVPITLGFFAVSIHNLVVILAGAGLLAWG